LLLAHAQHNALPLLQVADLCGAYGVSFVVMSGVLALLGLLDVGSRASGMRPRAVAIALPAVVVATAIIYGELQLRRWVAVPGATLRVGMVQGDVPLAWRRSAAHASMALDRLRTLTRDVVAAEPDLVVWPENAVGFAVAANESLFTDVVRGLAPEARLLLGAPRAVEREPGRVEFRNTAFLLDTAGHVVAQYDKRHLTPFAEYAPWPGALFSTRRFARADVYRPGDAWTLFDVRGVRFATLICYEAIYASVARRVVRDGAALLVNISNDDWFGTRSALDQHLYAALLGAVATRRTLVRVTNTGITAVIAPTGAVVARAPAGVPSTLVAEVTAVETMSPYTRVGDAFAWLCVLGTVVGGGIAAWRPSLESPGAGLLGPGKL
jgi:apolipoprotein N-acyltransferase